MKIVLNINTLDTIATVAFTLSTGYLVNRYVHDHYEVYSKDTRFYKIFTTCVTILAGCLYAKILASTQIKISTPQS